MYGCAGQGDLRLLAAPLLCGAGVHACAGRPRPAGIHKTSPQPLQQLTPSAIRRFERMVLQSWPAEHFCYFVASCNRWASLTLNRLLARRVPQGITMRIQFNDEDSVVKS